MTRSLKHDAATDCSVGSHQSIPFRRYADFGQQLFLIPEFNEHIKFFNHLSLLRDNIKIIPQQQIYLDQNHRVRTA